MIQNKMSGFINAIKRLKWVFLKPIDDLESLSDKFQTWGSLVKRSGALSLEQFMDVETDPFIKKGLRLVVDGTPAEAIKQIFETELHHFESDQKSAIKVWEAAGGYAPTLGILGAVLGLIHVMENLSDPSKLGPGIAVAFVATVYGVGLANIICLPFANKLKIVTQTYVKRYEMVMDALVSIANGEQSLLTEERISGYLSHKSTSGGKA